MAFIPVPNTARVELIYQAVQQRVENVLHFTQGTPFSEANLTTLANAVKQAWIDNVAGETDGDVQLLAVVARSLETAAAPGVEIAANNFGALSGQMLPLNVTVAMKLLTGLSGRSYRGRIYHVGLNDSQQQDAGSISTTAAANLLAVWNTFLSDVQVAGFDMVVASLFTNGAPRTTGIVTPVQSIGLADRNFDSQRRRLPGRGN